MPETKSTKTGYGEFKSVTQCTSDVFIIINQSASSLCIICKSSQFMTLLIGYVIDFKS